MCGSLMRWRGYEVTMLIRGTGLRVVGQRWCETCYGHVRDMVVAVNYEAVAGWPT